MNKNYERCSRCNRRKLLLSTGYLRRWLKPIECKHMQRSLENKRDFGSTGLRSCVILPECSNTPGSGSKFVKFWKTKVFVGSSVRSLQRYFSNKVSRDSYSPNCDMPSNAACAEKEFNLGEVEQKRVEFSKHTYQKCEHLEGHSVLRGHHQHASVESCALYCQLSKQGWYWGGITSREAEDLLAGQHDNVFLVRDSYDSRHLLCVSFRCVGRTLHARLRHSNGLFSLNNETFVPVSRISEHCATVDVTTRLLNLETPVRLARPLNRFAKLDSLQMVCRFVIRQTVAPEAFEKLPLPPSLINYVSVGSDYIVPH